MKQNRQAGFTLVELAIVLVIIGLLVGGVLVAQDLIKAAEIRAVSSDVERFNTGAAAFRTKYNGIPGDLIFTNARNFGLAYGDGNDGEGDGDGILENNTTAATKTGLGGENALFWTHLSQAQFIPYGITTYATAAGTDTALGALSTAAAAIRAALLASTPQLRIRDTGFIHAFGLTGLNYYMVGSWTPGATPASGDLVAGAALSPREAQGIDQKLDDGTPTSGIARSSGGALASMTVATVTGGAAAPTAGTHCYNSTTNAYFTASDDAANSVTCMLRIRTGF